MDRRAIAAILISLTVVAGCAQPDTGSTSPGPTGTPGTAIPTSPSPGGHPVPSPSPSSPPPPATTLTLTGLVGEGVSSGCLTFDADAGGRWTLAGKVRGLRAGDRIRVSGYRGAGLASHCQQGPIYVITEVVTLTPRSR
jgi:hypothetical protein